MKSAWMASGVLLTLLAAPLGAEAHDRDDGYRNHHGYSYGYNYGYNRGGYCNEHRHKRWKRHHHRYHSHDHRGWDDGRNHWSGHDGRRHDDRRHDRDRRGGWDD